MTTNTMTTPGQRRGGCRRRGGVRAFGRPPNSTCPSTTALIITRALQTPNPQDATFTRDPWPLGPELRKLPGLKDLSFEWDTALWAPGQTMHEWEALSVGSQGRL
jgi:hypothetical protein